MKERETVMRERQIVGGNRGSKPVLRFLLMTLISLLIVGCSDGSGTGGQSGSSTSASGGITFSQLKMIDATTGWALSNKSVDKTTDGGKSWTDVTPGDWEPTSDQQTNSPAIQSIESAFFLDADHAWIVAPTPISKADSDAVQATAASAVTVTADGTVTVDSQNAPSVKTQVYVRSTADGGQNWVTSNAIDVENLVGVSQPNFLDAHEGWLEVMHSDVQNQSTIGTFYHSVDGGITWTQDTVGTSSSTGTLSCDGVCSTASLPLTGGNAEQIETTSQLTGMTIFPACAGQGATQSLNACPSVDSSSVLGCTVTGAQSYVGWATGTASNTSDLLLQVKGGQGAGWQNAPGVYVPGGAPSQGNNSGIITSPPLALNNGEGVLPIQMQSDPNGTDPSHFFLHLYHLQVTSSDGNVSLSDLGSTSSFAVPLVANQHTLSGVDGSHIFAVGQAYSNGNYGDWNLYESDGKNWNSLNSQTDGTIPAQTGGKQPDFFNESLSNLDFISATEGWATNGEVLYHIAISNGVATWSQVYPDPKASGSVAPTRTPGQVVTSPANPGACAGQTSAVNKKVVLPGNGKSDATSHSITFVNNTNKEIWVGASGAYTLEAGGWDGRLDPGSTASVTVKTPDAKLMSGRFWGRTGCVNGKCETGDCGTAPLCGGLSGALPTSLAEFAFNGASGLVYYDVSLVDGYNLPMLIESSSGSAPDNCGDKACVDVNTLCPQALQEVNASGQVVACKSACTAFGTAQYCCTGAYVSGVCNPDTWPSDVNSAHLFKSAYPHAYSYAYDDATSTYTCAETCGFTVIFGLTASSQTGAVDPQGGGGKNSRSPTA